jgi:hypothetical protein
MALLRRWLVIALQHGARATLHKSAWQGFVPCRLYAFPAPLYSLRLNDPAQIEPNQSPT